MTKRKSPKKITNAQIEALDLYQRANSNIEPLIKRLDAQRTLAACMRLADKWHYTRGSNSIDSSIKLWITKSNRKLFTINSINRMLSLLHRNYNAVVLVKFVIIEEDGWLAEEKCDV